MSMEWLNLTGPALREVIQAGNAVAVLPLGSIEKHGEHLPTGTDTLNVEYIAREACRLSGAIMLPPMAYAFVNEMKASVGAVSLSARTFLKVLEEVCDDIARNGVRKIVLLNGHGGNNYLGMTFIQDLPGKGKDYVVYYLGLMSCLDPKEREEIEASSKAAHPGGHADDVETDITLYHYPETVDLKAISKDPRAGASLKDFDIGPSRPQIWWYAEYPDSLAGDPRFPSPERGKVISDMIVTGVAETLAKIKADGKIADRSERFETESHDPRKMR
jgi:creatinine amidohydrolase